MATALLERPVPIHDDATRRQLLIGGAALVALVAGCGSDDDLATNTLAGDGQFPVTVAHKYGDTDIPVAPQCGLRGRCKTEPVPVEDHM
ncbi:MAG: hypothetical protein ACT4NY_19505 [Pseudonocardiales bacterium]